VSARLGVRSALTRHIAPSQPGSELRGAYCEQALSREVDSAVTHILGGACQAFATRHVCLLSARAELRRFQERTMERNPSKAKMRT
jgi:hypothetical protein